MRFNSILMQDGFVLRKLWGLLESDYSIHECLVEASSIQMSYALRRLLVTILIFCEPTNVRSLWNEFYTHMVKDYPSTSTTTGSCLTNMLLRDLKDLLLQHGKKSQIMICQH